MSRAIELRRGRRRPRAGTGRARDHRQAAGAAIITTRDDDGEHHHDHGAGDREGAVADQRLPEIRGARRLELLGGRDHGRHYSASINSCGRDRSSSAAGAPRTRARCETSSRAVHTVTDPDGGDRRPSPAPGRRAEHPHLIDGLAEPPGRKAEDEHRREQVASASHPSRRCGARDIWWCSDRGGARRSPSSSRAGLGRLVVDQRAGPGERDDLADGAGQGDRRWRSPRRRAATSSRRAGKSSRKTPSRPTLVK